MSVLSQGRAAVYEEPSGPTGVHLRERRRTGVEAGHVAIAIRAASLNHLDLWLAQGSQRVQPPRVLCADGAGIVAASGDARWKTGDEVVVYPVVACWDCEQSRIGEQVFCESFGILGEHVDGAACELFQVPAHNVYPKPAALSWEEAAAFPLTFLTAYRMLTTRARLRPGETLLVLGAGAGVATAGILIGRHQGARVLVTSRSEAKRKRALELGAEAAFPSEGFSGGVRAATGGHGADVVFEHVGPATLGESVRSAALGGRIVFCGSTSGVRAELGIPRLFIDHLSLLGSTMGNASEFGAVLGLLQQGIKPVVDTVYALEEVRAALEHLERAEQFGKVVLSVI